MHCGTPDDGVRRCPLHSLLCPEPQLSSPSERRALIRIGAPTAAVIANSTGPFGEEHVGPAGVNTMKSASTTVHSSPAQEPSVARDGIAVSRHSSMGAAPLSGTSGRGSGSSCGAMTIRSWSRSFRSHGEL